MQIQQVKHYFLPSVVAFAVFSTCFIIGKYGARETTHRTPVARSKSVVALPWGVCLNLVVSCDGVRVGRENYRFDEVEDRVLLVYKNFGVSYVTVYGTTSARYGDVISVFNMAKRVLDVDMTIATRSLKEDASMPDIERHDYFWGYGKIEGKN